MCTRSNTPFPTSTPQPCLSPRPRGGSSERAASQSDTLQRNPNIREGSTSPLSSGLTCTIPSRSQGVLLGPKGEEALLGTVEPDAGLLEAVEIPQGQSLVPRAAEHRAAPPRGQRGSEKKTKQNPQTTALLPRRRAPAQIKQFLLCFPSRGPSRAGGRGLAILLATPRPRRG